MNEQALEVLVTAYLEQQFLGKPRQLRGFVVAADGTGGFCTLGLLLHAVGCNHLTIPGPVFSMDQEAIDEHQACLLRVSERFMLGRAEWLRLREENDHYDWLTIAAKHFEEATHEPDEEEEED